MPPLAPMLAKAAATVPPQPESGDPTWSYEPKWDGFRAIIFRDGDEVVLGSRGGKDLARYFPEAVEAVKSELPEKCVVDGELVVPREIDGVTRLSWEALSERIHPAASRVALLSEQTPAQFVGFDLLALGDRDVSIEDFGVRRALLLDCIGGGPSCHVTAATADSAEAMAWFETFEGAGLDGVVAKKLAGPYLPNKREMIKVKHARTADVVLLGYRPPQESARYRFDASWSVRRFRIEDGRWRFCFSPRRGGSSCWPNSNLCGSGTTLWPKARPVGGDRPQTARGFRFVRSGCWKWHTTRWKGNAFGTLHDSCAGVRTGCPTNAHSISWRFRCDTTSRMFLQAVSDGEPGRGTGRRRDRGPIVEPGQDLLSAVG